MHRVVILAVLLLASARSASASPITIERNLSYTLGVVYGEFGRGQVLSSSGVVFFDPFTFDLGDTLIFNILFDQRLQLFDFAEPTLEEFLTLLDNGYGVPNSFSGTWVSSIEALGGNGNIWSGPLTLAWQGGGGGIGWGGQGINLTDTQGSMTGIRWTTRLTSAREGAPLTFSAFDGVTIRADGIRELPLTPVPEPTSLLLLGSGIGLLVKFRRKQHP